MALHLRNVLSEEELARIHERSLEILAEVGIQYSTPRALEVLEDRGCKVDYERQWASLPPDVVQWALQQPPRVVTLRAREAENTVILDGKRSHHTTDSQGTQAVDFETGELHDSTLDDLRHGLRFADALDMVEIVNVMVSASDVPSHLRTLRHFAEAFTLTGKHVRTGVLHAEQVPYLVEMVKIVSGKDQFTPLFSTVDCTISPLMHDGPMTEACIELARRNVPIMVYPMPLSGGTSPVTRAGTVLLHNVEFLSGLTLFQAVNPGTPVIYGTGSSQMDMRTGGYGGSPDGHGMRLALADLAHHYRLPVNMFGSSTSSLSLDAQYGHEATTTTLLAYLMGADEIYSVGLLGDAQVLSLEKMVLDNHLLRQLENVVIPFQADEVHLQAELIKRVGIGGQYLTQPETRDFTRREYIPKWPPVGKEMMDLIREEAAEIYRGHQSPPLPEGAEEEIERLMEEADQALEDMA